MHIDSISERLVGFGRIGQTPNGDAAIQKTLRDAPTGIAERAGDDVGFCHAVMITGRTASGSFCKF
jgi:hypothetical protein